MLEVSVTQHQSTSMSLSLLHYYEGNPVRGHHLNKINEVKCGRQCD